MHLHVIFPFVGNMGNTYFYIECNVRYFARKSITKIKFNMPYQESQKSICDEKYDRKKYEIYLLAQKIY